MAERIVARWLLDLVMKIAPVDQRPSLRSSLKSLQIPQRFDGLDGRQFLGLPEALSDTHSGRRWARLSPPAPEDAECRMEVVQEVSDDDVVVLWYLAEILRERKWREIGLEFEPEPQRRTAESVAQLLDIVRRWTLTGYPVSADQISQHILGHPSPRSSQLQLQAQLDSLSTGLSKSFVRNGGLDDYAIRPLGCIRRALDAVCARVWFGVEIDALTGSLLARGTREAEAEFIQNLRRLARPRSRTVDAQVPALDESPEPPVATADLQFLERSEERPKQESDEVRSARMHRHEPPLEILGEPSAELWKAWFQSISRVEHMNSAPVDVMRELERRDGPPPWLDPLLDLTAFHVAGALVLKNALGVVVFPLAAASYVLFLALIGSWLYRGRRRARRGLVKAVWLPDSTGTYAWVTISPFDCHVCGAESPQSLLYGCYHCGASLDTPGSDAPEQELKKPQFDAGSPWLYLPHAVDERAEWLPGAPDLLALEARSIAAPLLLGFLGLILFGVARLLVHVFPVEFEWFGAMAIGALALGAVVFSLVFTHKNEKAHQEQVSARDGVSRFNRLPFPQRSPWYYAAHRDLDQADLDGPAPRDEAEDDE